MAIIDFEPRGSGTICSVADLAVPATAGTEFLQINYGTASLETDIAVGTGLMLGGEFCVVREVIGEKIRVSRGCADSIPKSHLAGTPIWFFSDDIGSDRREYLTGDALGVKVLMKTATRSMGVGESPPNALTMSGRFARPYPPGQVFAGVNPFYDTSMLTPTLHTLEIIWAHRDRITQADQLYGHEVGSIGPEIGTTYTVQVFQVDDTLVRTIEGIEGTGFNYTFAMALADLTLTPGLELDVPGYFTLHSVRDGYTSKEAYRMDFIANAGAIVTGWGNSWGYGWGL